MLMQYAAIFFFFSPYYACFPLLIIDFSPLDIATLLLSRFCYVSRCHAPLSLMLIICHIFAMFFDAIDAIIFAARLLPIYCRHAMLMLRDCCLICRCCCFAACRRFSRHAAAARRMLRHLRYADLITLICCRRYAMPRCRLFRY